MTRAIGYIRRSTENQHESLDQQREKLEAFAKTQVWELVRVYSDDAVSGSEMRRAGLGQLLSAAASRDDVDVVLAWDRNRLARPKDPVDGLLLERKLIERGKRVVYAGSGQEVDRSFTSGLISYVEHYQNGDYLRKLSRDTMRGLVSRAKRGLWPGGRIPFGYDRLILDAGGTPRRVVRDLEDGSQVVIDAATAMEVERVPAGRRYRKQEHEGCTLAPSTPERVRAVRKMFSDYAAGKPTRRLRDDLNEAGYRTSRGKPFTVQTILPMLENPAYTGRCVYNRSTFSKWHRHVEGESVERHDEGTERRPESDWIVRDNAWPAIIDSETFAQVRARRRTAKEEQRRISGTGIRSEYLLTGLTHCGICGARLCGQTTTSGKGYRTAYYICGGHHAGDHAACPKRYTVPAKVVEDYIVGLIRADLAKLRDDDKLHEYIAAEFGTVDQRKSDARRGLQRRVGELDQHLAKLRDHLKALDSAAAEALGLYDEAKRVAEERTNGRADRPRCRTPRQIGGVQ